MIEESFYGNLEIYTTETGSVSGSFKEVKESKSFSSIQSI